jgi:hypothetical protein
MRYILMSGLLTVLATSVFAQLNTVPVADVKTVADCFPKAVVIIPSDRIDPLMLIKPSEKFDSRMLVEILCPGDISTNKNQETDFPPTAPNVGKKTQSEVKPNEE